MSDRQKSTPPPFTTADERPLRELFLVDHLPRHRETLERLCRDFHELAHEAGGHMLSERHGDYHAELGAVVADLRLTAAALRYYEEPLRESELTPRDSILCKMAGLAAPEVETVASRIERTIQAVEARRLPVVEPFPDDFVLVVLFPSPGQHARWERAAGDQLVRVWLAGLADWAASAE